MTATTTTTVELTHNIDMQNKEIATMYSSSNVGVTSVSSSKKADGTANHFTIKNVKVKANKSVSLFGYNSILENVTVSNVVINANYKSKNIGGLAAAGTAKNVVVDGLTINLGEFTDQLMNIGGVFATADADDFNNVEVKSCKINHDADVALDINAGIIAGTLNVRPDTTETLEGIKLTGDKTDYSVAKSTNKWYTNKASIDYFKSSKKYQGRYPFGVVNVSNAVFGIGNTQVYLKVNKFESWSSRLAAGIVFADELTSKAADKVEFDASKVKDYKYSLTLENATIGTDNYKVFGFNPAPAQ